MLEGRLIKGIGGFYYVEAADAIYECKARGVFRKRGITPLVGDMVKFTVNDNAENTIDEIMPRRNSLVRPPLANLEQLFIVSSMVEPAVNTFVLDRLIAIAEYKNIEPVIVFTKTDLCDDFQQYVDIYSGAGFKVVVCDNKSGKGADEIKALLTGKISAFTGNSGVGKSTLLNNIDKSLGLETGITSKKLGRGKHTTRHSQLYKINDGYVADTPGFSAVDLERCEKILKDDLPNCFREFEPYLDSCRFMTNCSHINDKGCAVKEAVDNGKISKSRHDSYVALYNEVKDIKEWEMK